MCNMCSMVWHGDMCMAYGDMCMAWQHVQHMPHAPRCPCMAIHAGRHACMRIGRTGASVYLCTSQLSLRATHCSAHHLSPCIGALALLYSALRRPDLHIIYTPHPAIHTRNTPHDQHASHLTLRHHLRRCACTIWCVALCTAVPSTLVTLHTRRSPPTQEQVTKLLSSQANVEPALCLMVWQKLEDQNPKFFQEYHVRSKLKEQVVMFNYLLEQQVWNPHTPGCGMCGCVSVKAKSKQSG